MSGKRSAVVLKGLQPFCGHHLFFDELDKEQDQISPSSYATTDNIVPPEKRARAEDIKSCPLDPALEKYWYQRYLLFSKFDDGIMMDQGMCGGVLVRCLT